VPVTDVWLYVAPDQFQNLELVRAEMVARVRQEKAGREVVFVDTTVADALSVRAAEPVSVIGEPDLPPLFALGLPQALAHATARAASDGFPRLVTARLRNNRTWEWGVYLLDEPPASWRGQQPPRTA
jgi:hypothetical protein